MIKKCRKPAIVFLLSAGLYTIGAVNLVRGYDGDVDYSAPYVTLDPETGKLITVDPKQQAAGQQPQHGTTDPAAQQNATDTTDTAAVTAANTGTATTQAGSSGTNVIAAVIGIVIIGVIVAMVRRKSGPGNNSSA